jgi:alpha-amylase/alpha-mannosidase (GH57 family)
MTQDLHQYLCIYGHFYQPPREDPFTGYIPPEHGAMPFDNFNEKITAECYRPNAEIGNFEHISFDLGPTLALWLQSTHPDIYARIIEADRNERSLQQPPRHQSETLTHRSPADHLLSASLWPGGPTCSG